MVMTVRHNTDVGAPPLNGVAGSLITLLDFVLVTGAGWTKPFTGTNIAVYRAPAGRRFFLRVDDSTGPSAACISYETMSDVNTGTGAMTTVHFGKSNVADASTRDWSGTVSDRGFFMWTAAHVSYPGGFYYGDLKVNSPNDQYAVIAFGSNAAGVVTNGNSFAGTQAAGTGTSTGAHFIQRPASGIGGPIACAKRGASLWNGVAFGAGGHAYPNPADGSILLSQIMTVSTADGVRGAIPGLWNFEHSTVGLFPVRGDTFAGAGDLAGRTFAIFGVFSNTTAGRIVVETTDWDY